MYVCVMCVCMYVYYGLSTYHNADLQKRCPHKITSIKFPYQQKSELNKENIQGIHYQKRRNQDQLQKDPPVKKTLKLES